MKPNNKGLTLVELLVSVAIFGLVSLGAAGFIITGTKFHNDINQNVQLQYNAQLTMTMIQEYAVDCSRGIATNETQDILYLCSGTDVHVLEYNAGEDILYYWKDTAKLNLAPPARKAILAENVTDLLVQVQGTDRAERMVMTIKMERGSKTSEATQVTALRNEPPAEVTWAKLWEVIK